MKSNKYNFSKKHWGIIFLCYLLFMIATAVTTDSENVILPKLAAQNNWDYSVVLTLATVAGVSTVVGNLLLGKLCEKRGGKFSILFGIIASAFFVFLYGTSKSLPVFVIGLIGTICCGQSISFFGANSIIANWFPTKKGLAMGFVTVGPPTSTIVMVSVLNMIINKNGVNGGIYTICIALLVMAIVCVLTIKNTPEEVGCTPDNLPVEKTVANEKDKINISDDSNKTVLTTGEILKNRDFWAILFIVSISNMCLTGLMAQWLVRYTSSGFPEAKAATLMSICAIVGIFGSIFAGYVENKLGTKKAYAVLAAVFATAFILNVSNILPLMYISVPMFGMCITLFQIFMPAFEITVFGRDNFKKVNGMIFPIACMSGQAAFIVIAACIRAFGEVRFSYIVFAILLLITIMLALTLRAGEEEK